MRYTDVAHEEISSSWGRVGDHCLPKLNHRPFDLLLLTSHRLPSVPFTPIYLRPPFFLDQVLQGLRIPLITR